jgi:hypothetical protein
MRKKKRERVCKPKKEIINKREKREEQKARPQQIKKRTTSASSVGNLSRFIFFVSIL